MPEYVIKCAPPITVAHLFLQGILAAVCPDFLRTKPHPDLHIQTPQWWHWLLQQCLQRAGLLLNNWHCGVSFWASHCASPHYHSKYSLHMWKYFVDFHLDSHHPWLLCSLCRYIYAVLTTSVVGIFRDCYNRKKSLDFFRWLIKCEYFSPTDHMGCLRSGDDRKRCHLPHHLWLFCRVWRWGRLQLGAVVECL